MFTFYLHFGNDTRCLWKYVCFVNIIRVRADRLSLLGPSPHCYRQKLSNSTLEQRQKQVFLKRTGPRNFNSVPSWLTCLHLKYAYVFLSFYAQYMIIWVRICWKLLSCFSSKTSWFYKVSKNASLTLPS